MAKKKVFSLGTALSQGLEETIESAQNYSGELRVDVIPLRKIELDPDNPRDMALTMDDVINGIADNDAEKKRKSEELESLQSLANSIKTQGIINPVMVYKFGEKYRLVAGERRTLASLIAGKNDIQVKILDDKPEELKVSLLQWIENIERSDLSLWERLTNLEKIVAEFSRKSGESDGKITAMQLAELIGCSKAHAARYNTILSADTEIRVLISEHKINNLDKAVVLLGIKSHEQRTAAIDACINGASLDELKKISEQKIEKIIPIKAVETRGRQSSAVKFGETKNIKVAKLILDSLFESPKLVSVLGELKAEYSQDFRSVSEVFKQVLKTLEKLNK